MKNRIKELRKIVVDGEEYKWLVQLKVWDSNKKLIIEDKDINPNEDITPSPISKRIKGDGY